MWWLIGVGFGCAYLGYRILALREHMIETSTDLLKTKIRKHRELARKGNQESLRYLQSLDAALIKIERENSSADNQVLYSLQFEGLYPPSVL